jgi:hypothetical protein
LLLEAVVEAEVHLMVKVVEVERAVIEPEALPYYLELHTQSRLVEVVQAECQIPMEQIPQPLALLLLVAVEAPELLLMELAKLVVQVVAAPKEILLVALVIPHLFHHHKVQMVDLGKVFQP